MDSHSGWRIQQRDKYQYPSPCSGSLELRERIMASQICINNFNVNPRYLSEEYNLTDKCRRKLLNMKSFDEWKTTSKGRSLQD